MSRVSYCSLEEAWGNDIQENLNQVPRNSRDNVNTQINKYKLLMDKSENDREEVIQNMNKIERIENKSDKENEFDRYRNNPNNIVKKNDTTDMVVYSPYKENIDKKLLHDKLMFLEKQLRYYQELEQNNSSQSQQVTEHFGNITGPDFKSNDMIDLIILIIIGLLIIFVMDFVFKMGKKIGSGSK